MAAGYATLALAAGHAGAHHGSVLPLLLPLLVTGIGMGMLTAPLTGIVLAQVAPQQAGTVSGLQATIVQLGNSIGVAVIGLVFFNAAGAGAAGGGFPYAFRVSLIPLAALPLAAAVAIQFVPRPAPAGEPTAVRE
jgi:MFS family permease